MVEGPDIRVQSLPPVRPATIGGVTSGPAKGEAGAPAREVHSNGKPLLPTGFDSVELNGQASLSEMPISILSSAVLTRSEWGWRRFLSDFALMKHGEQGAPSEVRSEAPSEVPPEVPSDVSSDAPNPLPQSAAGGGTNQASAGLVDFTRMVAVMRQVIDQVARLPMQQTWQANWPQPVDAPQVIPFAMIHDASIPHAAIHPIREWTLSDRLSASVQDTAAPFFGGGVCLIPLPNKDSARAVRWRAHRSSHEAANGTRIHRLVVETQMRGDPARITIVSHAVQLAVHVETNDRRLRTNITGAEMGFRSALSQAGFVLQNLSVSTYLTQGGPGE